MILKRIKYFIISIFIAVNICMIVTDSLPDRSAVGNVIMTAIAPYQVFFGLDQSWSMFGPNPSAENSYVDAEMSFTDGSKETWTFPRPSRITGWERILGAERYRKYIQENLEPMQKEELWFDMARFVARDVAAIEAAGQHRTLEEIQFYRHWNVVPPPDQVFIPHGQLSTDFATEPVFHYRPGTKEESK